MRYSEEMATAQAQSTPGQRERNKNERFTAVERN